MSECTHNCSTCGHEACGSNMELDENMKQRDILVEMKNFMNECENEDIMAMFDKIADDIDKEM